MLVVNDDKIRDLLNLVWLNTDKVQLSCRVEAKSEPKKKISAEFAKLMTEGEMKVRCN